MKDKQNILLIIYVPTAILFIPMFLFNINMPAHIPEFLGGLGIVWLIFITLFLKNRDDKQQQVKSVE